MRKALATAVLLVVVGVGTASAQAPTGAVAGFVADSSGAALSGAQITIVNRDTGQTRTGITSTEGRYGAEALPPGIYRVTAEAAGFTRRQRDATVDAGTTTTMDLVLEVGDVSETVTVSVAAPRLDYEHHQVAGIVTREQIENLPLNGRNFLELAKLEPGVTTLLHASNNRTLVPILGAGLQNVPRIGYTQFTVDGGSINALGTIGSIMQVSQEVVQEFQISSVNFDAPTNLTSSGAINIVTRSGGSSYRGDGFFFYRDHNLAAYPGLSRDPGNPDPFFERRQVGSSIGGPVRRDRAFFFASYERNDQQGVESRQPRLFPALGGIFPSPYLGNQFSARVDLRLSSSHNAYIRHTRDGSSAFAPGGGPASASVLPSAWARLTNEADQTLAAITSTLSPHIVNEARVSYFFVNTPESPATLTDCPAPCVGLGGPRITIQNANVILGAARTLTFVGGRYQLSDNLVWQRAHHRLRLGFDWEHSAVSSSMTEFDQAQITLFGPQAARLAGVPVPASFTTVDDVLQLPLRSFQTEVGPGTVLQRDFGTDRILNLYRLFASDTWRAGARLTVNAGLGWSYEPHALNDDLSKPALLVPILGTAGLTMPAAERTNFAPMLGVAWTATADGKTVVRAGVGRYYDPMGSTNSVDLASERLALSPLGTGRLIASGANLLLNGRPLDFSTASPFTGAQLLAMLQAIQAPLLAVLNPNNRDFALRNIDRTKQASSLIDPAYQTPYAIHVNAGVQRELAGNVVVSADFVWRRFVNTFITGIDYNRWDSAQGPVIPKCGDAQREDVSAVCSNGPILFSNTSGRSRYTGLLVRAERRLSHRTQFLASYALGSWVGTNGVGPGTGFNNDNWVENDGPLPTDVRHVLNMSGLAELPWGFQVAVSVSAYSRPPFSAYVVNADFNGDGTRSDLLPGTTVNQFGRGLDKSDLAMLVQQYNREHTTPLTLPPDYSFNDSFFTQDLRVTRVFAFGRGKARLSLIGEVFNLFNTPNLVGYGGDLTSPTTFGQPSNRSTQVFGSGGPRAFQFAARVAF